MLEKALSLLKAKLGISSPVRDEFLRAITGGVIVEIKNIYGYDLQEDNLNDVMLLVDIAEYRYNSKDYESMPRRLQFRLHNLMIGKCKNVE